LRKKMLSESESISAIGFGRRVEETTTFPLGRQNDLTQSGA
jgi:hypothetical protein